MRSIWTHEKDDSECICSGCGKLLQSPNITHRDPDSSCEKINGEYEYDYDHPTLGLIEYCKDCESERYDDKLEPGDHDLFGLRDLGIRPERDDRGENKEEDRSVPGEQSTLPGL